MYALPLKEDAWLHISKRKNAFWERTPTVPWTGLFPKKVTKGFFKCPRSYFEKPLFAKPASIKQVLIESSLGYRNT